jgi:hypothetical protein
MGSTAYSGAVVPLEGSALCRVPSPLPPPPIGPTRMLRLGVRGAVRTRPRGGQLPPSLPPVSGPSLPPPPAPGDSRGSTAWYCLLGLGARALIPAAVVVVVLGAGRLAPPCRPAGRSTDSTC